MALHKRGKIWHTHFFVDGQRYRQSLGTSDWREAQKKEKELIAQASEGKLTPVSQQFSKLGFSEAAERYLESRKLELAESSIKKEKQLLVQPKRYFGPELLARIGTETLLGFREWRAGQKGGPAIINMEMGVIRRILKRARRWHLVAGDLRPLRERRTIGRAMSLDEKLRLARLAASNPDWQTARLAMTLALNTTMRGCEIKALCWRDIDLMGRVLTILKSKTEAGERVIPLNATAYAAVLELRERAKKFAGLAPDHFVFPACENGHIDPTKPQKSWRTAWRQLTQAVECPVCHEIQPPSAECRNKDCKADLHELKSSTAGLRFHDLRHHAITELAESQASDQTIMAAGLNDDLNTAQALGAIFDMVREANAAADAGHLRKDDAGPLLEALQKFDEVFAVLPDDDAAKIARIVEWADREGKEVSPEARELAKAAGLSDSEVDALISEMQGARKARNFGRSDAIRAQLNEAGIIVEITKDGARWRRK